MILHRAPDRRLLPPLLALWAAVVVGGLLGSGSSTLWAAPVAEERPDDPAATFDEAWSIIARTHFDPTFNGVDWDAVRRELRPRAAAAETVDALRAVIREMLDRLGQSHFVLIPADRVNPALAGSNLPSDESAITATGVVGFDTRLLGRDLVVTRVVPGGPAADADVRPGWIVAAIDGRPASSLLGDLPSDQRRATLLAWTRVNEALAGASGTTLNLTFTNEADDPVSITLQRVPTRSVPVRIGHYPTFFANIDSRLLSTGTGGISIGVVQFNAWMPPLAPLIDKSIDQLRDADGVIVDLRGNPGGIVNMVSGLSGHFLDRPVELGTMETRDSTLRFAANPRRVSADGQPVAPIHQPLAILLDPLSASASEIFAGGLQAIGRARIFGEPSMGAVLGSVIDRLPNGDVLQHALGDFVTPGGVRLEGRGVVPDEIVPLRRRDLLEGRDPALEAAVRWILSRSAAEPQSPPSDPELVTDMSFIEGWLGITALLSLPPPALPSASLDTPTATSTNAAGLPSPREIIDRYIAAIGGRDAVLSHTSRRVHAKLDIESQGLEGELEILTARPNRLVVRTLVPGVGQVATGFDGEVGWMINPMTGPMLLTGVTLEQLQSDALFDAPLHGEEQYKSLETLAVTDFEGRRCYAVRLIRRNGQDEIEYFDVETGLLAGTVMSRQTPMGTVKATIVFEAYEEFDGVRLPSRTRQRLLGAEQVISVLSMEVDTVADEVFTPPPAIRTLLESATPADVRPER